MKLGSEEEGGAGGGRLQGAGNSRWVRVTKAQEGQDRRIRTAGGQRTSTTPSPSRLFTNFLICFNCINVLLVWEGRGRAQGRAGQGHCTRRHLLDEGMTTNALPSSVPIVCACVATTV